MKYSSIISKNTAIIFFVLCLQAALFPANVQAQDFPSEIWHPGKVVLLDGDTLKGQIKYDMQNDLVQLNANNSLHTISARKFLYFEIFDKTIDSHRHFYALPYKIQHNYEVPIIFEVLYEGKMSLLSREEIVTENMPMNDFYGYYSPYYNPVNNFGTRTRLAYRFYFLNRGDEIKDYLMKKNDLIAMFGRHQKEVKQYMKKNNLKHDEMRDLVRITAYYNALVGA